jgi:hypothetical protein
MREARLPGRPVPCRLFPRYGAQSKHEQDPEAGHFQFPVSQSLFSVFFSYFSPQNPLTPTPLPCGNLFSTILFPVTYNKSIACIFALLTNQ